MSYDFVTILGLHYINNANYPAPVTASVDDGVIKGDLVPELYTRKDLTAITPTTGGVGPLTITCLFDHLLQATY